MGLLEQIDGPDVRLAAEIATALALLAWCSICGAYSAGVRAGYRRARSEKPAIVAAEWW